MLVIAPEILLGTSTTVKITSVGRWSVFGELISIPTTYPKEDKIWNDNTTSHHEQPNQSNVSSANIACCGDLCECSAEVEPVSCGHNPCGIGSKNTKSGNIVSSLQTLFMRRRKMQHDSESDKSHSAAKMKVMDRNFLSKHAVLDWVLIYGMISSFLIIVFLLVLLYPSSRG